MNRSVHLFVGFVKRAACEKIKMFDKFTERVVENAKKICYYI